MIERSQSYPQGAHVTPRLPIEFVNPESGRKMRALPGQLFWVTNPAHQQPREGVKIQRKGKGHICTGPAFDFATFADWFVPA